MQMSKGVKNRVIAVTGGIGSGKTTVGDLFARWGATVVDADVLARKAVEPDTPGLKDVVKEFGAEILTSNGTLDRAALGKIVFNDPVRREKLEQLIHPRIRDAWLQRLKELRAANAELIVYVVPLYFETVVLNPAFNPALNPAMQPASYPEIDSVVLVAAPLEQRLARVGTRDGHSENEIAARMSAQLPDEEKRKLADYVIENNGTLEELERSTRAVFNSMTGRGS